MLIETRRKCYTQIQSRSDYLRALQAGKKMKEIGRNDPCPCGSGKKYKKCCMGKKPRSQYVYVGFREPFQGVSFDCNQVWVHLPSGEKTKADAVLSQTQYTRKSGKEKVVYSIDGKIILDVATFFASYDFISAIDTNTKLINGDMVSVSAILECYPKLNKAVGQVKMKYRINGNTVFKNCPNNASERYAWARLIAMIASTPAYRDDLKVALVTDHDLNRHHQYNTRQLPIYEDFYLPANFELVYASGDAKTDSILNMFIAKCDENASDIIRQLEKTGTAAIGNSVITIDVIKCPLPTSVDPLLLGFKK